MGPASGGDRALRSDADAPTLEFTMYNSLLFRVQDLPVLENYMKTYSFGMLVTTDADTGTPFISHIPLLYEPGDEKSATRTSSKILGHVSVNNPQWRHFRSDQRALCVFNGPHSYVSPKFYTGKTFEVPTWNYVTVHVRGDVRIIEGREKEKMLKSLIVKYEHSRKDPWRGDTDELFADAADMLQHIVAFEITKLTFEGKAKIGQNRSKDDFSSLYHVFHKADGSDESSPDRLELSKAMERLCPHKIAVS